MATWAWALLGVVGLSGVAANAAEWPSSAPRLGPRTYTITFTGSVEEALQELRLLTQVYLERPSGDAANIPVVLDFKNATLDAILLSLCEQAGLVYDAEGGGQYIRLRPGDLHADPRPTALVDDYVVRVTDVTVNSRRSQRFRWGQPEPDPPEYYDGIQVTLSVAARTEEALAYLAGLDGAATAQTDTGETLRAPEGLVMWFPQAFRFGGSETLLIRETSVNLPPAPQAATELRSLQGALRLYSTVKTQVFQLSPDDLGLARENDDVTAKLLKWDLTPTALALAVEVSAPPLAAPARTVAWHGHGFGVTAALMDAEGKEVGRLTSTGASGDGKTMRCEFQFSLITPRFDAVAPAPPAQAHHALLTVVRRGPADRTLPFVLHSIPLP